MEKLLVQGQSQTQLLTAEGISTLFNGRDDLFNDLPLELDDFESLFAQPLENTIRLDGNPNDWGDGLMEEYLPFGSNGFSDGDFELLLGERSNLLYLHMRVLDDEIVYRDRSLLRLDNSDQIRLDSVREVSVDDLLGRDKVQLDWMTIRAGLRAKTVLVTGGGGSVGVELCRQLADLELERLIVFDNSELNLYQAEREIKAKYPKLDCIFLLGDIRDAEAVEFLFEQYHPSHVYHAAAYKHVPILENYLREAVSNNVLGTNLIIDAAARFECETFVLISTDKAVKPSSIMGATKRIAELLCAHKDTQVSTNFMTVRFGNVLGSTGSVVPLFRSQIEDGGPVTVTHPDAKRYFMTVSEASQLILEASTAGSGGEVFVLDMGEPVNIRYLAEQVIRLSGKILDRDVRIEYIGLRPGEKLDEELFHSDEELSQTKHDKLLLSVNAVKGAETIGQEVTHLKDLVRLYDEPAIHSLLKRIIPTLK